MSPMLAANDCPFAQSAQHRRHQVENTSQLFAAASLHEEASLEDGRVVRPLFAPEVETLKGPCRCRCQDWSKLRLILSTDECRKDQSNMLEQLVSYNTFADLVVIALDVCAKDHAANDILGKLPPGVHSNTLISNCIIESNCRVYHNRLLSDTHIGTGAILMNCGRVSCSGRVLYGEIGVTVGPESGGGRHLTVTAESTMIDVCSSLGISKKRSLQERANVASDWNMIGPCSVVRDTPSIENVFLAANSDITAAASVRNATLLNHAKIGNACTVSNVLLQWNSSIVDNSSVSNALLMEEAHSGPHSLVASTILGPDVYVSAGEVHASVLGPNTNAHHQSLLIGVLWPLGRGNVGYGANIGSNHTGRLPDQETTAGEGTFWGLSTVIKFPVDLTWSPYTIVAAGTSLPPQRIVMPFSLMVDGTIIPAWVLQNSPYTVSRSEAKFSKRRKAERHSFYTGWKMIRPNVIDMCLLARESLRHVRTQAAVYKTDTEVDGIGQNRLTEKARVAGIQTYSECIQLYALRGLLDQITSGSRSPSQLAFSLERDMTGPIANIVVEQASWPPLPWEEDTGLLWNHQLCILRQEFPVASDLVSWIIELLHKLVLLQNDYAKRVHECKRRDDVRGASTVPGYADSHVAADYDSVVIAAHAEARRIEESVGEVVTVLTDHPDMVRSRL